MELLREDEGARAHFAEELTAAQKFVEENEKDWADRKHAMYATTEYPANPAGGVSPPSGKTKTWDWNGAIHYFYSEGDIKFPRCTQRIEWVGNACGAYAMTWEWSIHDIYDWPLSDELLGKTKWWNPKRAVDVRLWTIGMLHYLGEARAFRVGGVTNFEVEWTRGARYPKGGCGG